MVNEDLLKFATRRVDTVLKSLNDCDEYQNVHKKMGKFRATPDIIEFE